MNTFVNTLSQRDFEKIISAILYVVKKLGNDRFVDHHSIFKALYLADKKRLGAWGTPIFNEQYIKMEWGPVPSTARDIFKKGAAKQTAARYKDLPLTEVFDFHGESEVGARIDFDGRYFAKVDVECLDQAIQEIKAMGVGRKGFIERTNITHDSAWEAAELNRQISRRDILIASGNTESLQAFDDHQELEEMIR